MLNSPDVPDFVMDVLVYHEMLHAELPNQGHSKEFKRRERMHPERDEADIFLDTIHDKFIID